MTTAKGYVATEDVESFLQQTLSAAQKAEAERLIPAIETFVDRYCDRAWLTGAVSLEAHYYPSTYLWLKYPPVTSVDSIVGRTGLGNTEETLTEDEDYEVQDLTEGMIRLVYPATWDRVRVSYTPATTVPADLTQACAELVVAWMQPSLRPDSYGLDSYSLPDLTVRFSRAHVQAALPPAVLEVLDDYAFVPVV